MPKILQRIFASFLIISSFEIFAAEDEHAHSDEANFEDHASHEHGHATAQISFSNTILNLELLLPSIDIFGFEHTPQNDEQRKKVHRSKLILKDVQNILTIKPNESCHIESVKVESVVIDSISEKNDHGHKEDHEDEHHQDKHHEDEHSDVSAHYVYKCSDATPESIDFMLFDHFHTLEDIEVQLVSDETQVLSTVTPDKRTQSLK